MRRKVLVALAAAGVVVPAGAVISAASLKTASTTAATSAAAAPPATPDDRPTAEGATKMGDSVGRAWGALKKGARDAWENTAAAFKEITRRSQKDVVLSAALPGALSAKMLIGVPIENVDEGRIGSISDIVLGKDSHIDAIVVSDGGFLGIGNAQIAVKPQLISLRVESNGRLRARTRLTEQHLDEAAMSGAFMTRIEAMREDFKKPQWRTVTKIIGAQVVGPNNEVVGTVSDLLLSPVGEAQFALLSIGGGTLGIGTKQVAVTVGSLHFTTAGAPLTITMPIEQLKALAPVRSAAAFAN